MAICVIFNPAAQGEKASQLRAQLQSISNQCVLKPTTAPGAGRALAAQAAGDGFDTIVAAGGDGTVQEVVTGLAREPGALARVRLGILPVGTVNVFARELNIPRHLPQAWRVIQQQRETVIDLPFAQSGSEPSSLRHYFAQLAGAGLDSRAIALVDWEQKKALGPFSYVVASFRAFCQPHDAVHLSSPSHPQHVSSPLVIIGNGRYFGGSFNLFPKAKMDDGLLDVLVFPPLNWESVFAIGYGCLAGQIHSAAGAQYLQTDAFTLSSSVPMPFQLDGDNVGFLPVTFSVLPRALRVLVP